MRPGALRGMVLLFSRRSGWSETDQQGADLLAGKGVLVVGIDTGRYLTTLAGIHEACHLVVGDAESMAHQVQRSLHSGLYFTPILAGVGEGGRIAEQVLSVAASNTIGGAVSIDPRPISMRA
jgi:type IV secretory pathway VirJ component